MLQVRLLPQYTWDAEEQGSKLGSAQLLQLLARLPALRELSLRSVQAEWPQQLSAYSALTASSNLQSLVLHNCEMQTAAWPHVFPAWRELPHLHTFEARSGGAGNSARAEATGPAPFDSTGIAHLVSCCPALASLRTILSADASLAPLHSLAALTRLDVWPVTPVTVSSDLAALSQLRQLILEVAVPVGEELVWHQHLLPLTALANLTSLCCSLADVSYAYGDEELSDNPFVSVQNQVGAGRVCLVDCSQNSGHRVLQAACRFPF
jgi:hypothetical protein